MTAVSLPRKRIRRSPYWKEWPTSGSDGTWDRPTLESLRAHGDQTIREPMPETEVQGRRRRQSYGNPRPWLNRAWLDRKRGHRGTSQERQTQESRPAARDVLPRPNALP